MSDPDMHTEPYFTPSGHWDYQAACTGADPDLFFPETKDKKRRAQALAYCDRCQVRVECLQFALDNGLKDGIFGGLNYPQRRRLTGAGAGQRHGTTAEPSPFSVGRGRRQDREQLPAPTIGGPGRSEEAPTVRAAPRLSTELYPSTSTRPTDQGEPITATHPPEAS